MHQDDLFLQFRQETEIIKNQINEISNLLDEEKLPEKSSIQAVLSGIDRLQQLHHHIREYAEVILTADEMPAEDAPVSDIRIAIEQSLAFQIQQKIEKIVNIYQSFLSVYSEDPEFSEELTIYQGKTNSLLDELKETQELSEEMEKLADAYSAFLSLIQIPDVLSDEWDAIYEPLEDAGSFSGKMLRGLRKSKFILPEQTEIDYEEKVEDFNPTVESSENTETETKIQTENDIENDESDPMEENFLTPRNPIKNKMASTGSFLKIIQGYDDPYDMAIFLPLVWRLGPVSISILSAVWDTLAQHSPLHHFVNKYFATHPKETEKFDTEEEKQPGYARKQAENDLLRIVKYMEKENVLSVYDFPGESGSVFCLTPYAYECMGKEKIRTYRFTGKGPWYNKPIWTNFFRCMRKFTSSEKMSRESLLNACEENKNLLLYIALVSFQKGHNNSVLQFMNDIEWDGVHYHVNVFQDDKICSCVMLNDLDEITGELTKIILCAPDTNVQIESEDHKYDKLFLFTYDQPALYERVENDWKIIYQIPSKNITKSLESDDDIQTEAKDNPISVTGIAVISTEKSEKTNENSSEINDNLSVQEIEITNIVQEIDYLEEIAEKADLINEPDHLSSDSEDSYDIEAIEKDLVILQNESAAIPESADVYTESFEHKILMSLIESGPDVPEDPDFSILSAAQIAMFLYENNIDPGPATNHNMFYTLIYQLIAEKKIYDAIVLSRALGSLENQTDFAEFCRLLEAACDIEVFSTHYTGAELQNLYNLFEKHGYKKEEYILVLTAAIRGLFNPTNETGYTDYQLRDIAQQLVDQYDFLDKKIAGDFKNLVDVLVDMNKEIPEGFSDEVINLFKKTGSKEKKETELSEQAESLLKMPANTIQLKDLSTFIREYFGPKSRLYEMLSYVQQKDIKNRDEVEFYLEEYYDKYKDFSDDNLKRYVQDLWRSAVGSGFKLQFGGLNNVVRAFKDRFELLEKWLRVTDQGKTSMNDDKNKNLALKTRKETLSIINQINEDLENASGSAFTTEFILSNMLSGIYNALQNEDAPEVNEIDNDFYLSHYLIFDENGFPVQENGFNNVLYYEPWRTVLRHLLTEKIKPEDALQNIKEDSFKSYWGDNYGFAKCLVRKYALSGVPVSTGKELEYAYFTVYYGEHFVKELEMAAFYGKISENLKDTLMEMESSFRHYFQNTKNYGQYRYFLNCLNKRVTIETAHLTAEKNIQLAELPKEIKIERAEDVAKIQQLIKNQNFTAADDKLNRLKNNEDDLWPVEDDSSYFDHFLSVYDDIYKLIKDNRGVEVATFYESVLSKNKKWEMELSRAYQKNRKSRRNIFPNWGKENEFSIKTLFEELDFPVKNVKKDKEYFVLTVEPSQKNLPEYPHPIAKFGTRMDDKIRVVYKKGVVTANSINDISKKNSMGGTGIIILADYAIPLDERRKIVEDFMSSDKEYPFIVIDRVLLFYLAAQEQANRMQVLLECTLPFSYTQPYVDGKGDVPDEMFFGRHTELTKIRLGSPACLVYGGRQLGKTALLKRTANLENKPDEKQFAVYIDAKENNVEKTVSQIAGKLGKLNIISNQPKTMGDLCNSIERKLTERKSAKRLLLLIDEADAYLTDDREKDYEATKKLWDLHREFPNDFKFVFAGLHNVARTAKGSENNSLIGQFNMVPIGQLSKKDAEQLIQKPLRYLGFRMKDEQIASIIENANYYPGVLQYFCHEMLTEVYGNYKTHFSAMKNNPPYEIKEDNLKKIISKANLSQEIKERLSLTLKLDPRYMFMANVIAYLYYRDRENGILNPHGYSMRTIKEIGKEFAPVLDDYDYNQILPEMVVMGILSKENENYKLRRASFLEMINDEEAVTEYLLSEPFRNEGVKDE